MLLVALKAALVLSWSDGREGPCDRICFSVLRCCQSGMPLPAAEMADSALLVEVAES